MTNGNKQFVEDGSEHSLRTASRRWRRVVVHCARHYILFVCCLWMWTAVLSRDADAKTTVLNDSNIRVNMALKRVRCIVTRYGGVDKLNMLLIAVKRLFML
jgi:hypothetical protein